MNLPELSMEMQQTLYSAGCIALTFAIAVMIYFYLSSLYSNLKKAKDDLDVAHKMLAVTTDENFDALIKIQGLEKDNKILKSYKETLTEQRDAINYVYNDLLREQKKIVEVNSALVSSKLNLISQKIALEANSRELGSRLSNLAAENLKLKSRLSHSNQPRANGKFAAKPAKKADIGKYVCLTSDYEPNFLIFAAYERFESRNTAAGHFNMIGEDRQRHVFTDIEGKFEIIE